MSVSISVSTYPPRRRAAITPTFIPASTPCEPPYAATRVLYYAEFIHTSLPRASLERQLARNKKWKREGKREREPYVRSKRRGVETPQPWVSRAGEYAGSTLAYGIR